jgi:Spy/CpxP family protein refolding chaperone
MRFGQLFFWNHFFFLTEASMAKFSKRVNHSLIASTLALAVATSLILSFGGGFGGGGGSSAPWVPAGYDDHQNMMDQLGIKTLRPGKSGNNQTGKGFDEATANDWMPTMPEVLTMKNGTKVTTKAQWPKRRAEILEDFEREVYGRIPKETPKITWEISEPTQGAQGGVATVTRRITGRVDNSAFPQINVSVNASVTVPANAPGPVPLILEFGMMMGGMGGGMGASRGLTQEQTEKINNATQADIAGLNTKLQDAQKEAMKAALAKDATEADVKAKIEAVVKVQVEIAMLRYSKGLNPIIKGVTDAQKTQLNEMGASAYSQLYEAGRGGGMGGGMAGGMGGGAQSAQSVQSAIQYGWGYGTFDTASVQADAGGNALRQGIIGLCNKGEPRKPDDWGSLRAWQWGISRLIDAFETHPELKVDPKKVAVEGVSRYGKAAIVAEAFEPRVAVALVASSGEGGVKLHRHDFGEAVENLTGGEYYWMCGNFLKYGASDIKGKSMNASDIPVDSHQLIALCAPRPCFISYGVEPGDPKWVDAPGSYRAGILASTVYELFGGKGYGDLKDWVHAPLPPVGTLVGGELAFRQHSGGHTAGPNFQTFFQWISKYIKSPVAPATSAPATQR